MEVDELAEFYVLIPSIENMFSKINDKANAKNEKISAFSKHHKDYQKGFESIRVKAKKSSRIQHVISQIARTTNIKYFKDFRLVIEKEYSHRVVDDDEIVHKVLY